MDLPFATVAADSLVCRLCGRRFRAISNSHLVRRHGFDPAHPIDDYKDLFGLDRAECEETRRRQVESLEGTWERQGRLWTQDRVREEIATRAAAGEPMNSTAVRTSRPQLILAARKLFGSWDRALEAAGLEPARVRARAVWTPEMILESIRALPFEVLQSRDTKNGSLGQAARRAFGSWDEALRRAHDVREPARTAARIG